MGIVKKYKSIPFLTKLLIAMAIGVILGVVFGERAKVLKPFGTVFLNLVKMAALPLVIVNLIAGIASLNDPKILGRVGLKIMIYYMLSNVVAVILGLSVGFLFKPGAGFILEGTYKGAIEKLPTFGDTIIGLLPSNIFASLNTGRIDQIILFSAFLGITLLFLPPEDKARLTGFFDSLAKLFNKMIKIIMIYAPIGICALMATTVGTYGNMMVGFVVKYIGATYVAILLQIVIYMITVMLLIRMSPIKFLKKSSPLIITALSTSSSLVCVPIGLNCSDDLGVPRSISSFTIPLGAQANQNGNGIMLALSFLFAAQAINVPISAGILAKAVLIALIMTTGSGGIPGGGIMTIAIIIDAFGLPLEVVGIISGVFALIDMGLTMVNTLGDLVGTAVVAYSEDRRTKRLAKAAA